MPPSLNFSQILRPVGQMLEPLQIESLSLRVDEGGVSVRAQKRQTPAPPAGEVSLRVTWQLFRRKKPEPEAQPSSGTLELRYTQDDIARMDTEGQTKRKGAGGSPEAHTLSQILRAVGAFVDQTGPSVRRHDRRAGHYDRIRVGPKKSGNREIYRFFALRLLGQIVPAAA
jgi:hypothetical protein